MKTVFFEGCLFAFVFINKLNSWIRSKNLIKIYYLIKCTSVGKQFKWETKGDVETSTACECKNTNKMIVILKYHRHLHP